MQSQDLLTRWTSGGCALHTVEKALAKQRQDLESLSSGQTTPKVLGLALAYWRDYGRILGNIGHREAREQDDTNTRQSAYHVLQATHEAAARVLMDLAVSFGLDPKPIWQAAQVCQELLDREPWRYERKMRWHWPKCLGDSLSELPADYRQAVRTAEATLEEIRAKANVAERKGGNPLATWFNPVYETPTEPAHDREIDPDQHVALPTIAKRYGLSNRQQERLKRKLQAWRSPSNCTEWTEVTDRKPRQPGFLYRLGSIQHLIDAVKSSG